MDFKIIKGDGFNEIILGKSCFAYLLEFGYVFIQPMRVLEIQLIADVGKSSKHLVGPCVIFGPYGYGVPQQMIVFENFSPHSEHNRNDNIIESAFQQ